MGNGRWKTAGAFLLALAASPAVRAQEGACADSAPCAGGTVFPSPSPVGFPPASNPSPGAPPLSTNPPLAPLPEVPLSASRVRVAMERYPSGELLAERRTFDGKLDGPSKEYYKNGQVMNEWAYRLGELHGESRAYYRNGDLKTVWKYKGGKLHGETLQYHERGILKAVEVYKDGELVSRTEKGEGLPLDEAR